MKPCVLLLAAAIVGFGTGCREKAVEAPAKGRPAPSELTEAAGSPVPRAEDVWLRFYSGGVNALQGGPNATLKKISELPASAALTRQTAQRLATAIPMALWGTNASQTNLSSLLFPVLTNFFGAELYLEARGKTNGPQDWLLAVRLGGEQAARWQQDLRGFFKGGNGADPAAIDVHGNTGWEARQKQWPAVVRLARAGEWTVLSWGDGPATGDAAVIDDLKAGRKPMGDSHESWLLGEADLARVARQFHLPSDLQWPRITLKVSAKGDGVRTEMDGRYQSPVSWRLEPWHIPSRTIQDPINSFTAIQGLAPWVGGQAWAKKLALEPAPNTLFFWAQSDLPYQSYAAFPLPDATNRVQKMLGPLRDLAQPLLAQPGSGNIILTTNGMVLWPDLLPALKPYAKGGLEPEDNFVLAGVFPNNFPAQPLPGELLGQVTSRTNLLYYDWEITAVRTEQWRQMAMVIKMISPLTMMSVHNAGSTWLHAAGPLLGNTVTEITVNSPQQITLARKSHLGLTSVELMLLTHWLDNPEFPGMAPLFSSRPLPLPPMPGGGSKKK